MKRKERIYCNLCQKHVSDEKFIAHLLSNHMPTSKFICKKCCSEFTTVNSFHNHTISEHFSSDEYTEIDQFNVVDVFANSDDVIKHIEKSPGWIKCAFSVGVDNIFSKSEMQSRIKSIINAKPDISNIEEDICNICSKNECLITYCYFCADRFSTNCHLKRHLLKDHLQLPSSLMKLINFCDTCKKIFPSEKHLSRHRSREHRSNSTKKDEKASPFCHFCGKRLANKSNLKRHVLNQHSEETGSTPSSTVFTCDYCKCFFSNKSSVKRHIENLHLKEKDTSKSISCFQCEQRFNSIKNLNAHLTIEHKVTIKEENLQFADLNKFWEWKQDEEIRTNSRFIQLRGMRRQRRKGEEVSTLKFVCNRSGIFHSKSNGKRAYRIKGSSKIGRYCSAYIEIMFKDGALVDGVYCSTHSGHDNDLRYLTLTMDEKREIYEKIKNGSSFSSILNEIRNSVGKEIKRKHLVTNKDLHNIVTTFKKLSKTSEIEITSNNSSAGNYVDNFESYSGSQNNDRAERILSNDLDICTDLWVETCQRMVNRLDHIQPQTESKTSNSEVCKDTSNYAKLNTKSIFTNEVYLQHDSSRNKSDFIRNPVLYNSSSEYVPSCVAPNIGSQWNKFTDLPTYTSVHNQNEAELNTPDMSYYNESTRPAIINNARKDLTDICGTYNMTYSVSTFHSSDNVTKTEPSNMKVISCPNSFGTLNGTHIMQADISAYSRNVNNDYKGPSMEIPSHSDMFVETFDTPESQLVSDVLQPSIPNAAVESLPDSPENDDLCVSDDEVETTASIKNTSMETNNEESDLRDRVNSVTALYNIVENELDERKKKIIRNYVDNMFRVLQYRYNKCKTKKKPNSIKRTKQKSMVEKKISSRRHPNNGTRESRNKLIGKFKPKQQLNQPKFVGSYSCSSVHFTTSKNVNSYSTAINTQNVTNIRPEMNMMRWQY